MGSHGDTGRAAAHKMKTGRRGQPVVETVVGVQGFEPWTPCSQSRCATGLRYTPIETIIPRRPGSVNEAAGYLPPGSDLETRGDALGHALGQFGVLGLDHHAHQRLGAGRADQDAALVAQLALDRFLFGDDRSMLGPLEARLD